MAFLFLQQVAKAVAEVIATAIANALAVVDGGTATATTDASAETMMGEGMVDTTSENTAGTTGKIVPM